MYLKTAPFYIFLPAFLFFFFDGFAEETQTGTAQLFFSNAPDSAIVKVDGKKLKADSTGWYTVPKGLRVVELLHSDTLLYSSTRLFSESEEKKIIFYCNYDCGGLEVNSVPSGAHLSVDEEYTATTPAIHHFLSPGIHSLKLEMPGWETIYKDFEITEQDINRITFTLERSGHYRDSILFSEKQIRKTGKRVRTAILSILTTSLASASAWYEYIAQKHLSNAQGASDLYDAATGNFETYKTDYYHSRKKAKKAIETRNALTIATGIGLTGFFISLAF
jgi:hypothetical protein